MSDEKDYLWLIKTDKGDFFITVIGKWTQEEAAEKARLVLTTIGLDIKAMIPRKRATGPGDATGMLVQYGENYSPEEHTDTGLGFQFFAGPKLWYACGRGAEYQADLILMEKED